MTNIKRKLNTRHATALLVAIATLALATNAVAGQMDETTADSAVPADSGVSTTTTLASSFEATAASEPYVASETAAIENAPADRCDDIVIVLDESGSVGSQAPAVRDAVSGMLTIWSGKGIKGGTVEFGNMAVRVHNYLDITAATVAGSFDPYLYGTGGGLAYAPPSQTGSYTNWDDALDEVKEMNSAGSGYGLVLFVTDGEPTAYNLDGPGESGGVRLSTTDPLAQSRAVAEANAVKAQGSHILAVGVGSALTTPENITRLKEIAGPDVFTGSGSIDPAQHDVVLVPVFEDLADVLAQVAHAHCGTPDIAIDKSVHPATVAPGSQVTFTIEVTNTGTNDLHDITVSDPKVPACSTTFASLASGATETYTCNATITEPMTNTATATGTDVMGVTVTDSDIATVDVLTPDIAIVKSTSTPIVDAGGTAVFEIQVTNTGHVDLVNVHVVDNQVSACSETIGSLVVGASTTYECSATVTESMTNVATATGETSTGDEVSDDDTADVTVVHPAINIVKETTTPLVPVGGSAVFTIKVTNTGDVALSNVSVSDSKVPACDRNIGSLGVNESVTYECSVVLSNDMTNVATAEGTSTTGTKVTDDDDAVVIVAMPEVEIDKTASPSNAPTGSTITYTFVVTNTGRVDLTNVTVSDSLFSGCDAHIGDLAAGASYVYTCDQVLWTTALNVATVVGDGPVGTSATDKDDALVTVYADGTGTPGYWKNHSDRLPAINGEVLVGDWNHNWVCDAGETCLALSTAEALAAISTPPKEDMTYNVARPLVTAWFNVSVGNDSSCISADIATATTWLLANPIGSGVKDWAEIADVAQRLDDYNNGRLCAESRG